MGLLHKRSPENWVTVILKIIDTDASKFNCTNVYKVICAVISLFCAQLGTSPGQVVIVDASGHNIQHLLKLNLNIVRKFILFLENALPLRFQAMHIINAFPLVDKALGMVKPFVPPKLFNLIKVHTKMDTLYEFIPKDMLPKEYGGEGKSVLEIREATLETLLANMEYFKYEESLVVDESKRMTKSQFLSEINSLGMEGSFRKLEID